MQIAVKVPIGGGLRASVFARVSINARRAFLSGKVYFSKLCVLLTRNARFYHWKRANCRMLCAISKRARKNGGSIVYTKSMIYCILQCKMHFSEGLKRVVKSERNVGRVASTKRLLSSKSSVSPLRINFLRL